MKAETLSNAATVDYAVDPHTPSPEIKYPLAINEIYEAAKWVSASD